MNFGTPMHDAQRINPNDSGDFLTFSLASPAGQSLQMSCDTSQYLPDDGAKFCTDIYGSQRIDPTDLGELLNFLLAPP